MAAARKSGQQRLRVEACVPELDPDSEGFRFQELVALAFEVAQGAAAGLPASRPHAKLLFASPADALFAGAWPGTALRASVLGQASAVERGDGAFVVVGPRAGKGGKGGIPIQTEVRRLNYENKRSAFQPVARLKKERELFTSEII